MVRRSTSSRSPAGARFDGAEHRARSRRKRRAEQHPVDDRVFVALLEPRADLAIVALDPARPCGFQLRRGERVQLGRKVACQLGQNRPGFAETDESGRSSGRRRACRNKQQDADHPNVSFRNGPILSGFYADHARHRVDLVVPHRRRLIIQGAHGAAPLSVFSGEQKP